MSDQSNVPPPAGEDPAQSADVGEPERQTEEREREARAQATPNLDERERRISERRKPAGPPLEEGEDAQAREGAAPEAEHEEPPVDPA